VSTETWKVYQTFLVSGLENFIMNLLEHNRKAWNQSVETGNQWTIPVGAEEIAAAATGEVKILLSPYKPVPQEWMGDLKDKDVLCLASGGGQQGPILAAAGARVTVFDNSDEQLQRDAAVSAEFDLGITTVQGNMQDLSVFNNETFDLIIHPVSNCFIDDIWPVWRESYRVLKPNGRILSGFCNPILYMIDWEIADKTRNFELRHGIPYSDLETLSAEMKKKYAEDRTPFEFGHSLTDQIQGQIAAGFLLAGFYEDSGEDILDRLIEPFIATMAVKL